MSGIDGEKGGDQSEVEKPPEQLRDNTDFMMESPKANVSKSKNLNCSELAPQMKRESAEKPIKQQAWSMLAPPNPLDCRGFVVKKNPNIKNGLLPADYNKEARRGSIMCMNTLKGMI